ncbi:MAG: response regulator [bacterium]|nr:response regulator [bacterium]
MDGVEEQGHLVIVDDEDMVLRSIRSFLMLETEYEINTFLSAREAIEFIRDDDVDLVISDYLMPEMDGIRFLGEVKEIKPEITRIILTGYADKENAIKAINEIGLFQYIEKPWDNEDLRIIIRNGLKKKLLIKQIQEKIGQINRTHSELQSIQQEVLKAFV